MHLFSILKFFLSIYKKNKKKQGKSPNLPLSSCAPKLIYFLKRGKNSAKIIFDFKKSGFTWLVASDLQLHYKRDSAFRCFPVNFAKFLRAPFS